LYIIAYIAVIVFCALYAPQPLLIVLRQEFGVSESTVSLMITSALVPLSFAPLIYGYMLESVPIKKLLVWAVAFLTATTFAIFMADNFWLIIGLRFCQGLIIPAILTALMTYLSTVNHGGEMQRAFSVYVASTILGGFLGRAMSGAVSTMFGWRYAFLFLFILLVIGLILLLRLSPAHKADFEKLRPHDVMNILKKPDFLRVYLIIACVFFVFVSIPTFLPFRLTDITGGISEFRIGMTYSGYLMGIVMALLSTRLTGFFKNERTAVRVGLMCLLGSILIFLADTPLTIFLNMFLFCGCMAFIHARCSIRINNLATKHKGVANGLYISIYYLGGALGSYLPGWIYTHYGWSYFISCLAAVIMIALVLTKAITGRSHAGGHPGVPVQ
jgi:MFS transporter, YNFM family, putative membrane transport protein